MDLKSILASKKSKTERATSSRKPVDIADQDRPYSIFNTDQTQLTSPFSVISELAKILDQSLVKGNTKETQKDYKGNIIENEKSKAVELEKSEKQKRDTKGVQKENKEGNTKGAQKEHKENKGATKGTIKGTHKGTQREHKYSYLRGWNKKIVDLIHDICRETVSKVTYPLTNNAIAQMINMPSRSIKTTMQRLKSKGHIQVVEFNDGRGGWSRYTLPEEFFNEIPLTERVHKGIKKELQRDYKGGTKGNTQGDTNPSSSSSLNINNINKTTTELSDEWNFDIAPYTRFGFTASQLKQLASIGVISVADVEQSLIEFSYDDENNMLPIIKTNKINFLMGLLRAGHAYVSEAYRNEQDAMISEMARRAEVKRKKLSEEKFGAWEARLSDEEKKEIANKLPTHLMVAYRAHGLSNAEVRNWLFNFYLQLNPAE